MVSKMPDTYEAVTRLKDAGAPEPLAAATVDVVADATSDLVTRDILRAELKAELSHALLVFGGIMVSASIGIAALALAAMKLLFF